MQKSHYRDGIESIRTFELLGPGACGAEPRPFRDGSKDGSKTEQVKPSIAFVAEEQLRRKITRSAGHAAHVAVVGATIRLFPFFEQWRTRKRLRSSRTAPGGGGSCGTSGGGGR